MVYSVVIPAHIGMCYLFVVRWNMQIEGVATALCISWWLWFVVVFSYCMIMNPLPHGVIRHPFHRAAWSLYGWCSFLKVALPALVMVCLDWWAYEMGSFIIGLLHDSTQLAAHVACANLSGTVLVER